MKHWPKPPRRNRGSMTLSIESYLALGQFEKMDHDWSSITSMLARMIDRASDFCKYSPDTDYRETVNESPFTADDSFLSSSDGATP
jgi:hypothetical protein